MIKQTLLTFVCAAGVAACQTTNNNIQATQANDANMTCAEISEEIVEMQALISDVDSQNAANHAAGVGSAVGGHAVALSGLPFVGTAISTAGGIGNMGAAKREALKEDAENRVNALTGLYIGKGCQS